MDRRLFLVISVAGSLAIPFDIEAQRTARHPVVGFVSSGLSSYWAKGGSLAHQRSAFEDAFRDTGYAVGQDLEIYYRFAEGNSAKLSLLTADLTIAFQTVALASGVGLRLRAGVARRRNDLWARPLQESRSVSILGGRAPEPVGPRARSGVRTVWLSHGH